MNTQTPTDYIFRVGDGVNFWNSSNLFTWGAKTLRGMSTIKKGDRMWFITSNSNGKIIAAATFNSINLRGESGFTDEELGWTGGGGWDYEIHYNELYDVSEMNLLTNIKTQASVSRANKNCQVDLVRAWNWQRVYFLESLLN